MTIISCIGELKLIFFFITSIWIITINTQDELGIIPSTLIYDDTNMTRVSACEFYELQFCDETMYAPNDTDCFSFFRCNQGFWVSEKCNDNTLFDIEIYACSRNPNCADECVNPPEPFPPVYQEPRGPCPGVDEDSCEPAVNYPDRHSCATYYTCPQLQIARNCSELSAFLLESSRCDRPNASFYCEPRCPGVTFPDTSSDVPTTSLLTTPLITTELPSTYNPIETTDNIISEATGTDVEELSRSPESDGPSDPTQVLEASTMLFQTTSDTTETTTNDNIITTEDSTVSSSDSTTIFLAAGGGAAAAVVGVGVVLYVLHTKALITLPFTSAAAAGKAAGASKTVHIANQSLFSTSVKSTAPKVLHTPKLRY